MGVQRFKSKFPFTVCTTLLMSLLSSPVFSVNTAQSYPVIKMRHGKVGFCQENADPKTWSPKFYYYQHLSNIV